MQQDAVAEQGVENQEEAAFRQAPQLAHRRRISDFCGRAGGNDAIDGDTTEFGGSASRSVCHCTHVYRIDYHPLCFVSDACDAMIFFVILRTNFCCLFALCFHVRAIINSLCLSKEPAISIFLRYSNQNAHYDRRAFTFSVADADAAEE